MGAVYQNLLLSKSNVCQTEFKARLVHIVPGQPGLYRETLTQNTTNNTKLCQPCMLLLSLVAAYIWNLLSPCLLENIGLSSP